jgi:hypothetical protein
MSAKSISENNLEKEAQNSYQYLKTHFPVNIGANKLKLYSTVVHGVVKTFV